jgi:hypothetical protein
MRVSLQEAGFQLQLMDQAANTGQFFKWQDVTTMVAYKRDCFGYDLVCLAIADAFEQNLQPLPP